jgi:hypothetical protein
MVAGKVNGEWRSKIRLPNDFEKKLADYKEKASKTTNEATMGFNFLMFIADAFGRTDAKYAYLSEPTLEKYVKKKEGTIMVKGRIDALLGNVIVEFKDALTEPKIEDAESQIKKYVFALKKPDATVPPYNCIISDGVTFRAYQPRAMEGKLFSLNMVALDKIDEINVNEVEPEETWLWFDRYLLTATLLIPNTEEFSREFGSKSPAFMRSMETLKTVWSDAKHQFGIVYKEWADYLRIVYGSSVDSEELFLKHTYLATLSKLMVFMFYSKGAIPSSKRIRSVLDGSAFKEWGIINFLDEDFFTWVSKSDEGVEFCKDLLVQLCRYDLTQINEDILKGLYQDLVDPSDRHDLGEYYTPDWLADYVVNEMLGTKFKAKVLDPACGSGTFLVFAIRFKIKKLKYSLHPSEVLKQITNGVVGMDVHPLALIIARANYIMALGELLKEGRVGKVVIPVYLSDSLKVPEKEVDVATTGFEVYRKEIEKGVYLKIPSFKIKLQRKEGSPNITDEIIEVVKDYSISVVKRGEKESKDAFSSILFSEVPETKDIAAKNKQLGNEIIDVFFDTAKTMIKLIKENKDTIWAFILKNFYKPVLLKEQFDVVMGNPPWLSYRYVKSTEYQEFLKKLIVEKYGLTSKAELMTQMELATLFYLRAAEMYLKDGGEIGFVMPRSIFSGDQHDSFRRGLYKCNVSVDTVFDLDKVKPLFKVPSCVVMGKRGGKSKETFDSRVFVGSLSKRNASLGEAKKLLKINGQKLYLNSIGERSFISESKTSVFSGRSYYYDEFSQGATIVPRSFWFVDIKPHPTFGINPKTPFVESSQRAIENAKPPYKDMKLCGNVESEFIFGTLTGSELVPFGYLGIETIVLPLQLQNGKFHLLTKEMVKESGKKNFYDWLENVEKMWKEKRGEKGKEAATKWLDYRKKLSNQDPRAKFKVLYNKSGTYLASCIVDNRKPLNLGGLPAMGFVAEHTTYSFDCQNEDEAYYVAAFLNSAYLDDIVKPMQSRGDFGERDIHKKPLELPIPKFNPSNRDHQRLAEIGKLCTEKVGKELPKLAEKYRNLGKIRGELRKLLTDETKEIDDIVRMLLSQPKKGGLDDFESPSS